MRLWLRLPLLALLAAGCATMPEPAPAPEGPTAGAPEGMVDVIAHRGASAYAPENTLAAFERAIEMQADWFELDCRIAADDAIVVIHDSTLERTTGTPGAVGEKTLAELQALDAGAWFAPEFAGERIPTLAESLQLARDRIGVYVEIKSCADDSALHEQLIAAMGHQTELDPALQEEMLRLIDESGTRNKALTLGTIDVIRAESMERQVVVQSFSPVICLLTKVHAPELRVEFLGGEDRDNPRQWDHFLQFGYLIDVSGFNLHHESLFELRLGGFQRAGKSVAAWTVDDPARMQQLARWGVDALITNKPDVALKVLQDMHLQPKKEDLAAR